MRLCGEIQTDHQTINKPDTLHAISLRGKEWPQYYTLKVKFLDGSEDLRKWVKDLVLLNYEPYINLSIKFVTSGFADIRVSFDPDIFSFSYIGTDAWSQEGDSATMNIGWWDEGDGVVLHEFGHAIGAWVHEHQNPNNGITFNEEVVLETMTTEEGWSEKEVWSNILIPYSEDQIRGSQYDEHSVMHYYYPENFTVDGKGSNNNQRLSSTDLYWLGKTYPVTQRHTDGLHDESDGLQDESDGLQDEPREKGSWRYLLIVVVIGLIMFSVLVTVA